jgi:hypothetical protein
MDVQPTGKDIHYSAVTVLFCSLDLQDRAAEGLPLFQDRNISFLDIQQNRKDNLSILRPLSTMKENPQN